MMFLSFNSDTTGATSRAATAYTFKTLRSPWFFCRVCVTQSSVFRVVFYRSLFVCLYFFFWPLYCLSFFNSWLLITTLVYSNFLCRISPKIVKITNDTKKPGIYVKQQITIYMYSLLNFNAFQ